MSDVLPAFGGIRFGPDYPFHLEEARALLRSYVHAFRKKLTSSSVLPAIGTESSGVRDARELGWTGVWDIITFRFADGDDFTKHPHLGAWMSDQEAGIEIVLPNAAGPYWTRLRSVGASELAEVVLKVVERNRLDQRSVGDIREPRIFLELLQRHYPTRSGGPVDDARLRFDVDVAFGTGNPRVKPVAAWLPGLQALIAGHKTANMQLHLQACYPLAEGSVSRGPDFVAAGAKAAEALHPFLQLLVGEEAAGQG